MKPKDAKNQSAIGIDVGGTKISLTLGTAGGKILAKFKIPTRTGKETRACIAEMTQCIRLLMNLARRRKLRVAGIGAAVPGPVDSVKGAVPRSPHLPGWKGLQLAAMLRKKFKVPVVMANDANAAAVGEKIFGQAKKCRNFIYMTVSTGIGGGIIAQGKLLEGASFVAGEIGHMTIVPEGNRCGCGNKGCLEAYASGTAIARHAESRLKQGVKSALAAKKKHGRITARDVGLAALEGDRMALEAYETAGYYLGIGIANLLNILNPELITLGGGVWESAPGVFQRAMLQSCRRHAWPEAFGSARIIRSKLRRKIGDLGALALVFDRRGRRRESSLGLSRRRA